MLHSVLGRVTQTLWDLGQAALPLQLVAADILNGGQRQCNKAPTTKARRTYGFTIVPDLVATSCCMFLDRDIHTLFLRMAMLMIFKILKEYCDLSDRPVPTIFEFVPSKDQPLMFRENNLLVLKQDHFDKVSQSSDFEAYLDLGLAVLNGDLDSGASKSLDEDLHSTAKPQK